MWLHVAHSNNDPEIIAHYFLDCVQKVKDIFYNAIRMQYIFIAIFIVGCPQLLRRDLGAENSIIAVMQPMLQHDGLDKYSGINSHRHRTSTSNHIIVDLACLYTYTVYNIVPLFSTHYIWPRLL